MTASHDDADRSGPNASSGGDFDLPGFRAKPRKAQKAADRDGADKADGAEKKSAPKSPRAYGESLDAAPGSQPKAAGPKRTGKLPPGFKSGERKERPDAPRGPHPSTGSGTSEPRRKFAGDFRPRDGERGDRPARPYGQKPAWKADGPRKPYGSDRGGDRPGRPSRPYGSSGDKPAWRGGARDGKPEFRKPYGADRGGSRTGDRAGRGYPGSRDATAARPFEPELSSDVRKFLPLLTEKGRHKESRFLLEGAKNIADVAEHSPEILHTVLVSEGFEDAALKARLDALRVRTRVVGASEISALCGTETPQGIVAVANFGSLRPDWTSINTVTLLDGVQDPGNLGAILRTSAALGMEAVVLGKGTCDPYNPKVVRASAASLLRMPLETGEDLATKIHFLRLKGFTVVATSPHAKITLDKAKLRRKVALLFGNEGGGVGANLVDQADQVVRIPMKGRVESLNVAVAHGLLAYDLMRLRG